MTQHFLLTADARSMSPLTIAQMSDDKCHKLLCELRWGSNEIVVCPCCNNRHKAYYIRTRKQWQCKFCKHRFSVTSSTIFAHHKLPIRTILFACAIYVNAVKGISALQLARDLNVQYKTAFILAHKIRASLQAQKDLFPLHGEVHMDGSYVHSSIRQQNKKENRVDRRLKVNENPNKRCIIVMRNHYTADEILANPNLVGAKSTYTFVALSENHKTVSNLAKLYIEPSSTIHTDEHPSYDNLLINYNLKRVNHSQEYRSDDDVTNNLAESYFSRFKRMYYGQVHKMGNTYLGDYANEAAYREDTRRMSNGVILHDVLAKCLTTAPSKDWKGYWQGDHRQSEQLVA